MDSAALHHLLRCQVWLCVYIGTFCQVTPCWNRAYSTSRCAFARCRRPLSQCRPNDVELSYYVWCGPGGICRPWCGAVYKSCVSMRNSVFLSSPSSWPPRFLVSIKRIATQTLQSTACSWLCGRPCMSDVALCMQRMGHDVRIYKSPSCMQTPGPGSCGRLVSRSSTWP